MSVASNSEETQDNCCINNGDTESITPPSSFNLDNLPPSFKKFLQDNAIDPKVYTVTDLPRYIRLNTHCSTDKLPTIDDLKTQLDTSQVWEVKDGIFGFLHAKQRLVDTEAYKNHTVFGLDLSSAMAVEALDLTPDDQVLDLCCAPGAKLCMIANKLGNNGVGTVTGVDIAKHRLATCRSMVKKYSVGNRVRLFDADGTTFNIPPPARVGGRVIVSSSSSSSSSTTTTTKQEEEEEDDDDHATTADNNDDDNKSEPVTKKRRKNSSTTATTKTKPFWASKFLRNDTQDSPHLYDKVIVDAECTHDGSISHILKYEKWGWDAFEKNFMNPDRLSTICELQRNLMKQGWQMLKPGKTLVYSTCSLTIEQNEGNVAWFLKSFSDAQLEPVDNLHIPRAALKITVTAGDTDDDLSHCVRFDPLVSRTSGFFVARFIKKKE